LLILKNKEQFTNYYTKACEEIKYDKGSIVDSILISCALFPDNIAININSTKITYKELIIKIKECAKSLKIKGIKQNDVISIYMNDSIEGIIMIYAANMIGAISNLINYNSDENEIFNSIISTKSKMILTSIDDCEKIINITHNTHINKIIICENKGLKKENIEKSELIINWKEFMKLGNNFNENFYIKNDYDDIAIILSQNNKSLCFSNKNINSNAIQCRYITDFCTPGYSIYNSISIYNKYFFIVHNAVYNGLTINIDTTYNEKDLVKNIKKHDIIIGDKKLYIDIVQNDTNNNIFKNTKLCILFEDNITNIEKNNINTYLKEHGLNSNIRTAYNVTECFGIATISREQFIKENELGVSLPDINIKIIDPDDGLELLPNEKGIIIINSPNITQGYLNDKNLNKKIIFKDKDGKMWIKTNKIGFIEENGVLFYK